MIFLPWIILKRIAMTAMTNKICMIDPKLYAKKPTAHKMINTTATR